MKMPWLVKIVALQFAVKKGSVFDQRQLMQLGLHGKYLFARFGLSIYDKFRA
jgi:hypothetical protein